MSAPPPTTEINQDRPMARRAFVVNAAMRDKVRHLAGVGVAQDDIAKIIGCAPKTLRKRCRDDLDRGVAEANATVSGYLFASAKAGNVTAQIFWLKTRAQEKYFARKPQRQPAEVRTGLEGQPVEIDHSIGTLPDCGRNPLSGDEEQTASGPGV
ncbi:MAG: hypothetical protein E6G69_18990 [Alphaproteobacteria bacterium]|nr:MAG: hypothetical protein E6G69_18990 [Alphaproteobacteria bacterium]